MLQAIMAKPCSLVTRARAKFINFFHPYTPMHGDTASRKDDVKPGHDCERWNVCLFCFAASCAASVPGGSVLECLLFSIWKSLRGKNLLVRPFFARLAWPLIQLANEFQRSNETQGNFAVVQRQNPNIYWLEVSKSCLGNFRRSKRSKVID